MKISYRQKTCIVESKTLVKIAGFLSGGVSGAKSAKACAFFLFIFVRNDKYATPIFINHERIHIRQQLETLLVGSWLLELFEDLYSRIFLKMKYPEYYLYRATEQEAYRNQHNLLYLETRPWFNIYLFIKDKRKLTFVSNKEPEIIIGDKLT
jgi:hypothetical protein